MSCVAFCRSLPLLVACVACVASADSATRTTDTIASLRPYITSKALAGAVTLVVDKDRVFSHQAIGMADIAA
ncbi:MAG TPA: hypothetical protein VHX44_02460, partial [Planctomycetota bacterium]|nr:hypothetical protein [Planctomycetota bacterium]